MRDLSENERELLAIIWRQSAIARSDIARFSRLAQQSVHRLLEGLRAEGLIALGEADIRGRGKPSPSVLIDGNRFAGFGLSVGAGFVRYALVDLAGQPLETGEIPGGPEDAERVLLTVDRLLAAWQSSHLAERELVGVGLARERRRAADEPFGAKPVLEPWEGEAAVEGLARRFGVPAFAEASGPASALAEYYLGGAKDYRCFAYFAFNQVFDGGLMYGAEIFSGQNGNAGDIAGLFGGSEQTLRRALGGLACRLSAAGAPAGIDDLSRSGAEDHPVVRGWLADIAPELRLSARALKAVADTGAIFFGGAAPQALRARLATAAAEGFGAGTSPSPELRVSRIDGDAAHLGAALLPLHRRVYSSACAASATGA